MNEIVKQEITKEKLQELFRSNNRKINITDEALDLINQAVNDPVFDGFKLMETMITYQNVLEGSNAPLVDYINAIKFTSFLEANEGNYTDAYIKTFWSRDFIQDRVYASTDSDEYKQITSAANLPSVLISLAAATIALLLIYSVGAMPSSLSPLATNHPLIGKVVGTSNTGLPISSF